MSKSRRFLRLGLAFIFVAVLIAGATPALAQNFSDWSTPVNLGPTINVPGTVTSFPTFSKDGLTMYFTGIRRADTIGGWDIYVSRRATTNDPWGEPQNIGPTVNTEYDEGAPFLSVDGHRLYFQSNRPGGFGGGDLYVSRRHDKSDDFGWEPAQNLGSGVNTDANEAGPSIFEDDAGITTLYFSSDRPGGPGPIGPNAAGVNGQQGSDIYMSTLQPDDTFGPAMLVPELNTASFDRRPYVRRDGLEIFLSSDRPGTYGGLDLWVSTRLSVYDPWGPPVNLGLPVNGTGYDSGAGLSFDGTMLCYQSIRSGNVPGTTSYNFWVTTRTKVKGPK